jgi:hypothetical protein
LEEAVDLSSDRLLMNECCTDIDTIHEKTNSTLNSRKVCLPFGAASFVFRFSTQKIQD